MVKNKASPLSIDKCFEDIKKEVLKFDPVAFAEGYLTIDGKPIKLSGTGWKFLADIYRYVAIKALEPNGKPVVCVKGRQAGATTMAAVLELYFCASNLFGATPDKPPMRILHCFPALAQVQKFAKDRLSTIMRTSVDNYIMKQSLTYDDNGEKKKRGEVPEDTLTEKLFKYENKLWIDSNANDATRLQGMSLDAIFWDEVQRMAQDDIGNSKRTLTAAHYGPVGSGVQLYFGTPLQRGSNFHKMWEASDKRLYHLHCINCDKFFKLYEPGNNSWESIWLFGTTVECPHCKHQQDKIEATIRGKWIATQPLLDDGKDPPYVGFHFNQLLIPSFTREIIEKERPGVHPTNSDRIWQNEILGEFYSGSELPMTEEEIRQHCRNINRKISFSIPRDDASPVFMGIDWGGKADSPNETGGKSLTSIVIVSATGGVLQVENAFKLKKNDFQHKKDVVAEMYRRFGVRIGVADLGYGNDIVPELQREYSSRLIGCYNSGSLINPVKYDPEELRLMCNKDLMLDEIFSQMRKGKILFPWQSYEQICWLIEHCCSMEKQERTVAGQITSKYIKGAGPNDGLMALLYAYLAYKFYSTKGFAIKQHQLNKSSAPIIAYLPKM